MAFSIQYQERNYSAEEFLQLQLESEVAITAQIFINAWLNHLPFTFYSSGSTGTPKAFQFTKQQLVKSAQLTIDALGLNQQAQHILLCLHPKFVGGAMLLARALVLDCPISLFEPNARILELIEVKHSYTFASFVPMQFSNDSFDFDKINRIENILIGGTSISSLLENKLAACTHQIYHTYGMTETLSHVALRRIGKESSYHVLPGIKIGLNAMQCITIQAPFLDEEIHTNDLGLMDENGRFQLLGRTDFVINSGGKKIHPEKIEQIINEIAADQQWELGNLIMIPRAHETYGEQAILALNKEITQEFFEEIIIKLRKEIASFELPKDFIFLAQWPLTENGKVDRKKVIEFSQNQ